MPLLSVSSTTRVPAAADIPTIAETGVPDFDAVGWTLICVPAATPSPIVERLHAEFAAAVAAPDIRALIDKTGAIAPVSPPPAKLQRFLASEIDRWGDIIERAGVTKSQ